MSGTLRVAYDAALGGFDYVQDPDTGLLETDEGLVTAFAQSLFTDARATTEELRAAGMPLDDHRGHWLDGIVEPPGTIVGSKLWLLARALKNDDTLAQATQYAREATAWFVETGVCSRIDVSSRWWPGTGYLALRVEPWRPAATQPMWQRYWDALTGEFLT